MKGASNLRVENEKIQKLKRMFNDCNWRNFIHYYEPDEQSEELDEPDFDNDGITIKTKNVGYDNDSHRSSVLNEFDNSP